MLLKSADDKSKRLALLEDLQQSQLLDSDQRKWLRDELMRLSKGIQGEREAAYYLDQYFKDGTNHVVLHDLRFVVDDDVSQIDHLIINRFGDIYLLETKNYACNLVINDHGEFTAEYQNNRFGIPSPIEQSLRHERALCKLFERLDIVGRTQKQPDFHHVVMMHTKATIHRPPAKIFDTSSVIKADQFPSWHKSFVDNVGVGQLFKAALNARSVDTIIEWGEKLKRQHRPADWMALPEFMKPRKPLNATVSVPTAPAPVVRGSASPATTIKASAQPASLESTSSEEPAKRLICHHCGSKITYPEGKYCWNNAKRFGGFAYCRDHQALV